MKDLIVPLSEKDVRELKVGDAVAVTGTIYTGRDAVHKYLFKKLTAFNCG